MTWVRPLQFQFTALCSWYPASISSYECQAPSGIESARCEFYPRPFVERLAACAPARGLRNQITGPCSIWSLLWFLLPGSCIFWSMRRLRWKDRSIWLLTLSFCYLAQLRVSFSSARAPEFGWSEHCHYILIWSCFPFGPGPALWSSLLRLTCSLCIF